MTTLHLGLLINPMAGVGGPVGLKGSDGMYDEALRLGGRSRVNERAGLFLDEIDMPGIRFTTVPGEMGGNLLTSKSIDHECIAHRPGEVTTADDTRIATAQLCDAGIDLLLFVGGDGTARDIVDTFHDVPCVLGIPGGVKMHSGVFATTPSAAAALVNKLAGGEVLSMLTAEVRDIDEASFREGVVRTKFYGELPVPDDLQYVQATKVSGREVEEMVVQEIAADVIERLEPGVTYLMGSGSTVAGILEAMHLPSTLLGIDVVKDGELIASDASEQALLDILADAGEARIIVTAISGQGHIFGRGNQQLSAAVIRKVGVRNIEIVATKTKLESLDGRPLVVDTGDAELDRLLAGLQPVVTGYEDRVLYRVA